MRTPPTGKFEQKDVDRLSPEPWMLELLGHNPEYVFWGPHEDYMAVLGRDETDGLGRKGNGGWNSRVLLESWDQIWQLDAFNECVNFYFEINRDSKQCPACGGNCYHPDAQWVSESFYEHSSPFVRQSQSAVAAEAVMVGFGATWHNSIHGRQSFPDEDTLSKYGDEFRSFCETMRNGGGWVDMPLTDDELEALREHNREVDGGPLGHDEINRSILIEARLRRMGMPRYCPECDGHGSVFTSDHCHVSLILWMIMPRKGASRGVEINRIKQDELPVVFDWLRTAATRNADRFSRIPSQ